MQQVAVNIKSTTVPPVSMDQRKLHLIEEITTLENEALILQLETLLFSENDWWLDLSERDKQSLQRGMADAQNGRVFPFEEVMAEFDAEAK